MNVTFEETPLSASPRSLAYSGLTGLLLRHHVVKNVSQAQLTLIVIALVIFVLTGILFQRSSADENIDTRRNFIPAVPSSR